mgnify:CR=1 FL=1
MILTHNTPETCKNKMRVPQTSKDQRDKLSATNKCWKHWELQFQKKKQTSKRRSLLSDFVCPIEERHMDLLPDDPASYKAKVASPKYLYHEQTSKRRSLLSEFLSPIEDRHLDLLPDDPASYEAKVASPKYHCANVMPPSLSSSLPLDSLPCHPSMQICDQNHGAPPATTPLTATSLSLRARNRLPLTERVVNIIRDSSAVYTTRKLRSSRTSKYRFSSLRAPPNKSIYVFCSMKHPVPHLYTITIF